MTKDSNLDNQTLKFKTQPIGFWGRLFSSPTFWIAVIVLGVGLPLGRNLLRPQVKAPAVYGQLPEAEFIDQDSKSLKLSDLRGRILLVNFVFTRCPGTCPLLTAQMAKVQKRTTGSGPTVRLLSITVDPAFDSPKILKEYAEKYGARPSQWSFVTGSLKQIEQVLVKGFKVATSNPHEVTNLMDFTHAEQFVLVDQIGQIRGYKQLNNSTDIDNVLKEIAILANTNPLIARSL